jgi:hypothetical protein
MRRQRNGWAFPLDDAGADFGDFHEGYNAEKFRAK